MPQAAEAHVEKIVNGPESFTPDTRMIMGESAEVFLFQSLIICVVDWNYYLLHLKIDGYFIAAGTNANSSRKILQK